MSENNILDVIRNSKKEIVLFGAGRGGRLIYNYLTETGISSKRIKFWDNYKKGVDVITSATIETPPVSVETDTEKYIICICVISPTSSELVTEQCKAYSCDIYSYTELVDAIRSETGGGLSWQEIEKTYDWTIHRGQILRIIDWIDDYDRTIIDLGAGEEYLGTLLPPDVNYIPTDYVRRSQRMLIYDFNKDPFPDIYADVSVLNQILYYPLDTKRFLKNVCTHTNRKVIIFTSVNTTDESVKYDYADELHANVKCPKFIDIIIDILNEFGMRMKKRIEGANFDGSIDKEIGLLFTRVV